MTENDTERSPHHASREVRDQREPREAGEAGGGRKAPASPARTAELLMELDLELMKLLVRRARLVSRLRGGKDHAAGPLAVKAEKEVRAAWERNAVRFSRDTKFTRQFFALIQDLAVSGKEEAEKLHGFTVSPPRKPVQIALPGPGDTLSAALAAALSAATGQGVSLRGMPLSAALLDLAKALNQAGAAFAWTGSWPGGADSAARLHLHDKRDDRQEQEDAAAPYLAFADKVFYAGEESFTFHLLAFLAAGKLGKTRFTGGSALKMADLTPLRRFLPVLGARLAHTMPGSRGLPAAVEASGLLPERLDIPEEFGEGETLALLCAAATWGPTVSLDLSRLSETTRHAALARITPLFALFGVACTQDGPCVTLTPPVLKNAAEEPMPAVPEYCPDLDPILSACLLALPVLAGGSAVLAGRWPAHLPEAEQAAALLTAAGLTVTVTETGIETRKPAAAAITGTPPASVFSGPLPAPLRPALVPLGAVLAAAATLRRGSASLPLMRTDAGIRDIAGDIAESFYAALGLVPGEDGVPVPATDAGSATDQQPFVWTCPDAFWGIAYALAGYLKPRLRLANPGLVTDTAPGFWQVYNALPVPLTDKPAPVQEQAPAPARRRIRMA